MELSLTKLLLILLIVFLFFGAGKLPQVMGDIGRGMRALRDGLKRDDETPPKPPTTPPTQAS
jgi:sec-independent protein translocase protein TatA